ncbi:hypothetical protein [Asticcacaulis sp. AND118]|nr:hypothetical protein [Asticcacaulis sp. AND118]
MTTQPKDSTYYTKEQKRGEVTPGEQTTDADSHPDDEAEDERQTQ